MGELWRFLTGTEGEMIDRALLVALIVLAGFAFWRSIGQKLANKLGILDRSI